MGVDLLEPARTGTAAPMSAEEVSSPAMQAVLKRARRAAKSNITVLLTGETGVGKNRIARLIHDESYRHRTSFSTARATETFHEVMIAGFPKELIESELFGCARGGFTNAYRDRPGHIEEADGGTLFLDEIADVPIEGQVKLLGVLENKRVTRIGDTRSRKVDVRLICASQFDLRERVKEGKFRQDLYYRICVEEICIPPLRERRDDIQGLAEEFLAGTKYTLSAASIALLEAYNWPGNVRELRNVIERAQAFADGAVLTPADFPATMQRKSARKKT